MKVTKEDVYHVAKLSQLEIDENEVEMFKDQLSQILDWQGKLDELELEGLFPTVHALNMKNVTREDKERPSLSNEKALENAPEKEGNYFKVPRIIE
ncbi:Asp-tRNA(Asn)/Glu-tRNA(Gln) amidotransferase subunit GatC [Natranaerobius trueperi]|uniref:Aspartyl/glutamyl-tRNA(Asn/Gln) amidotransferase subunit C n=1 Tax=Natranaerobius trueperi TaxID=759412 RepID=A0A226C2A6_9FIRM|nr:Asp-tRNA(Asn)/Glu-tRNA(Gln) amidotransferase subunit GatC [Natranaerobius trueperi]OWZ84734.1 Asp-tRNA(Asn)/Glu-tRNA(Gln) amidotransferase GatCAB subunit C [Natranaerobius trueperi]